MKISAFLILLSGLSLHAEDWPQWLGPRRDSTWNETGLAKAWPAEGPKVLWRTPVGHGYSGPAVAGGLVFVPDFKIASGTVTANPSGRSEIKGEERMVCLDQKTGAVKWTFARERSHNLSFPNGPRCTPAVADGTVYFLGGEGHMAALKAESGEVIWEKDLKKEYGTESPIWGYSAHLLVSGGRVYTLAGGKDSAAVALDAKTGKEVWRALNTADIGYAPPVMRKQDGREELVIWHSEAISGLDPATGKVWWSQEFKSAYGMSIMAPSVIDDGRIFIGAMQKKSMMFKAAGGKTEVLWDGTPSLAMAPKNSTPVVHGGHLYGCDMDGDLRCFDPATGERLWSTLEAMPDGKKNGSGTIFLVPTPEHWLLYNDGGELILADLSPRGYKQLARAKVIEPTSPNMGGRKVSWHHPAFAGGCVFVRNDKQIVCLSLR